MAWEDFSYMNNANIYILKRKIGEGTLKEYFSNGKEGDGNLIYLKNRYEFYGNLFWGINLKILEVRL